MILIVTPFAAGQHCATGLEQTTGLATHWAETLQAAAGRLRSQSYVAVVLDQFLLEAEPGQTDAVLQHTGTASLLQLSFGVSSLERIVREVQAALIRRKREEGAARRSVESQIRSELGGSLTAMLLSCEMALAVPGMPEIAADRLRTIDGIAREMCGILRAS